MTFGPSNFHLTLRFRR